MRVTIVSQYFWPEQFRVNDLAVGLRERGHQVTVLTGQPSYPRRDVFPRRRRPGREWYEGVQVVRVPLASRGGGERWRLALNYLTFAANASLFGVPRLPPSDVVLVFQISPVTMVVPALLLRRVRGTPVVLWVQDLWPHTLRAMGVVRSERMLGLLEKAVGAAYQRCARVLGQSEDFLPLLRAAGVPADRLGYLPNWAEDRYRPLPPDPQVRREAALPEGFVAMVAGNLGVAQALETLVDAAERLRTLPGGADVQWVVVGDGQRGEWLADEISRRGLGDRVRLLGRHPTEQMPALLAHADVVVTTLRRDPVWALTVPSRVQSFLACGRPVVAAADGTTARVVAAAGGLAVPAQDGAALADAIASVRALAPAERAAMGAAAREYYVTHYERAALLDRVERHLRDAAVRPAAPERIPATRPAAIPDQPQPPHPDRPAETAAPGRT
ncbi:glycosyltransferase family 4 protein [Frankia sp. AgB1.9]|uniref:glycosyltransferase family 4 protein n=1 Tax=unclassified Frankia TaxID=2632575 RepID=UPI0019329323|nr:MULTISPECIES: glycosyltransferase family 4 protein [unclassified Frankia]MBL7491005.1 glycosyltransferase family 4 protein [Frankia sp. AgW1.1]MBL7552378.1 glycosyltransferase family 4 protein [Frankia sp. AgB1.9]MBL7622123.1 glycosyltransferase family 4 protein [Frankia sp. AgB1.8]